MTDHTKIQVFSWNIFSHSLQDNEAPFSSDCSLNDYVGHDPADPRPFYKHMQIMPEESRMSKIFDFALTQPMAAEKDFICLQQVSPLFVAAYFKPESSHSNVFHRVSGHPNDYRAIYVLDQVRLDSPVPSSGKQGILLLYHTKKWTLKQQMAIGNPFNYYFGVGSVQLFATFINVQGQELVVGAAQSYPHSWPFLIDQSPSIPFHVKTPSNVIQLSVVNFAKPDLSIQYVDVSSSIVKKPFDAKALLEEIPVPFEEKNYFDSEFFVLQSIAGYDCKDPTSTSYPKRVASRYRFILFKRPEGQRNPILSHEDLRKTINKAYLLKHILTEGSQLQVLKEGSAWPTDFDPKIYLLLLIDAMFIAETDALFFNERISALLDNQKKRSIAFLSQPFDVKKSILNTLASGSNPPWVTHLKPHGTEEKNAFFVSVFQQQNAPTWWLPCYQESCGLSSFIEAGKLSTDGKTYALTNEKTQHGIISESILFSVSDAIAFGDYYAAVRFKEDEKYKREELNLYSDAQQIVVAPTDKNWGYHKLKKSEHTLSDHSALICDFVWKK